MDFTPSIQQQDFFYWILQGSGNLVLEAVAGSGKSTTLIEGAKLMRGSIAAIMFNKAAAADFKRKAKESGAERQGFFISTCHGAGYSAWARAQPNPDVQENKVRNIIDVMIADSMCSLADATILADCQPYLQRVVSMAKNYLFGIKVDPSPKNFAQLAERMNLGGDLPEDIDLDKLHGYCAAIFEKSRLQCINGDTKGIIDYDDMIWAPLAYNARIFQNDWVLGDEWQDTNPSRRELAKRMLKRTGRFVAVGDSRQAIYQFTGANSDSLEITARDFNCARLPLSVSYRCPKAVVAHARKWVSHIEAHEAAQEGTVRVAIVDKPATGAATAARPWYISDPVTAEDAVLCRYNKPLVSVAFAMIRDGIACKMEGRDIGQGLIILAKRWKVRSLDALEAKLELYRAREIKKARVKRSETLEQAANDRVDCLLIFVARCREKGQNNVDCVVAEILSLFEDNVTGVLTLASGHRSKGREWNKVYWLETAPPGRELTPEEAIAEDNLSYVITTRSKDTLVLVPESVHTKRKGA